MVRHPMYMYLEAAIGIVPVMTLDRFVFLNASLFFLWIALPLEEDKLIDIFGQEYEDYRKSVPAFFPLWRWSWPGSSRDILSPLYRYIAAANGVAALATGSSSSTTATVNAVHSNASPTKVVTATPQLSSGGVKRRTSPASSQ